MSKLEGLFVVDDENDVGVIAGVFTFDNNDYLQVHYESGLVRLIGSIDDVTLFCTVEAAREHAKSNAFDEAAE